MRAKASSNPAFRRRMGVAVIGKVTDNFFHNPTTDVSFLTVLTRWDSASGKSISSSPMFSGPGHPLDLSFDIR